MTHKARMTALFFMDENLFRMWYDARHFGLIV
jgi:hypothetical protein